MKKKTYRFSAMIVTMILLFNSMAPELTFAAGDEQSISDNRSVSDEQDISVVEPGIDEQEDWLVEDNEEYIVCRTGLTPDSYGAEAYLEYQADDPEENVPYAIIMSSNEEASFFPGVVSISGNDLDPDVYVYTCSSQYWSDEDVMHTDFFFDDIILSPDTVYTYRFARIEGVYQYDEEGEWGLNGKYYFVTVPKVFKTGAEVTETRVSIEGITVTDYGNRYENIIVKLNNPDNERIREVNYAYKSSEIGENIGNLTEHNYNFNDDEYDGIVPNTSDELEVRVSVCVGKGDLLCLRKDIPISKRDFRERETGISINSVASAIEASVSIDPYYPVDQENYLFDLYYKKSDETEYNCINTLSVKDGVMTVRTPGLSENTEYDCYAELYLDSKLIDSTEALRINTTKVREYSKEDFKDPGLFEFLSAEYGVISDLTLLGVEELSAFGVYGNTPIKSLADIPEKLPNLEIINITGNDITDITPLLSMKYLREITLDYNDITFIPDISGTKWTYLSLAYNLISYKDRDKTILPPSMSQNYFTCYERDLDIHIQDTMYIDNNGNYPLVIGYDGVKNGRSVELSVNLNGKEKKYSYDKDSIRQDYILKNIKEDFGIEKDKEYKVRITFTDECGYVKETEQTIVFDTLSNVKEKDIWYSYTYEDQYYRFLLPSEFVEEYTDEDDTELDVSDIVENVTVEKDGVVILSGNAAKYDDVIVFGTISIYEQGILKDEGLEYDTVMLQADLKRTVTDPQAGDYDMVIHYTDEDDRIMPNRVHVTDSAVVEEIKPVSAVSTRRYDDFGEYYYLAVDGCNLNETVIPVITDDEGKIYSEFAGIKIESEGLYIYKLKKLSCWSEIEKAKTYTISLAGECIDVRSRTTFPGSMLVSPEGMDLTLVSNLFNRKTGKYEYRFNSSVPKGTVVSVSANWTYSGEVRTQATGSGVVGDDGCMTFAMVDPEGNPYEKNTSYLADMTAGDHFQRVEVYSVNYYDYDSISINEAFYEGGYFPPYALKFYEYAKSDEMVCSISVDEHMLEDGVYKFKNTDVEKLDPNKIYICYVVSAKGSVKSYRGYFTSSDTEIPVKSVDISPDHAELSIGEKMLLTVTVSPNNASNKSVSFNSSDPGVAAVEDTGTVTAVSAGTAVVTVTTIDGGYTASCNITVKGAAISDNSVSVNGVTLTPETLELKKGETGMLTVTVSPEDASNKSVSFNSSDTEVAAVDNDGKVTAVAEGKAVITVTTRDGGYSASCNVTVKEDKPVPGPGPVEEESTELVFFFANGETSTNEVYTGSAIKPKIYGYSGKNLLTEGVDYSVSYTKNTNAGTAEANITGKGGYSGSYKLNFTINPKSIDDGDGNPADGIVISGLIVQGNSKAVPKLYYNGALVSSGQYELSSDSSADGKETVTFTAKNKNFTGSIKNVGITRVKDRNELRKTAIKVSLSKVTRTYDGTPKLLAGELKVTSIDGERTLVEGTDYVLSYSADTINVGTVKVTVIGIGDHSGNITKSYRIAPAKNALISVSLVPEEGGSAGAYTFKKSGVTPDVSVTAKVYGNTYVLSEGTDYRVSYSGNKKAGSAAKVKITLLGNYKGAKADDMIFTINRASLSDAKVYAGNIQYKKPGRYKVNPVVVLDGELVAGSEYEVSYTDADGNDASGTIKLEDGETEKIITVTIKAKDKKNANYTNGVIAATANYRVYRETKTDISKATVKLIEKGGTKTAKIGYTGSPITFDPDNEFRQADISVKIGQNTLTGGDVFKYFDVSYANNVLKGSATIIIKAKEILEDGSVNPYSGMRTGRFTIGYRSIKK